MSTTPKLDALIEHGKQSISPIYVDALVEIREHLQRMPVAEPTRYPSEIETRLIELCELALKELDHLAPKQYVFVKYMLAAIKRDLGLA